MSRSWVYVSIYILTAADIVFSYIGLKQGVIEEGNPLMNFFMSRWPDSTVAGVLVGTALVMYFLYSVSLRVKWIIPSLMFVLTMKIFILIKHFYWIHLII